MHITEEAAWRDTKKIPFFRGQREEKTSALSDGGRQREIQRDEEGEGWRGKEIYWVRVRGEGLLVSGIKKSSTGRVKRQAERVCFFNSKRWKEWEGGRRRCETASWPKHRFIQNVKGARADNKTALARLAAETPNGCFQFFLGVHICMSHFCWVSFHLLKSKPIHPKWEDKNETANIYNL